MQKPAQFGKLIGTPSASPQFRRPPRLRSSLDPRHPKTRLRLFMDGSSKPRTGAGPVQGAEMVQFAVQGCGDVDNRGRDEKIDPKAGRSLFETWKTPPFYGRRFQRSATQQLVFFLNPHAVESPPHEEHRNQEKHDGQRVHEHRILLGESDGQFNRQQPKQGSELDDRVHCH
jgi:hypothetical protein